MKRLILGLFSIPCFVFGQENLNKSLYWQIQGINLQAQKRVINVNQANLNSKLPKIVSKKEFTKTKYKEALKPYLGDLSKLSSEELNKLIEQNKEFLSVYKANKIFLTILSYQVDKDLDRLIESYQKDRGNMPLQGKMLKITWVKGKNNRVSNLKNNMEMKSQKKKRTEEIEVEGYCTFTQTLKVYTKPFYAKAVCYFDNSKVSEGTIFGEIIPDLQNKQVIFKPIMFESLEGKKYIVQPILVLNEDQSSPNLATYINERELEKVLAEATKSSMQDTKEMLKDYIKNKGTRVQVNGDVVIENKQYSLANIGEYAIRDFLASLVEAGANLMSQKLSNIPVIFTIEKGSVFYIKAVLKPIGESLK